MNVWISVFGDSEFAVRLPSAMFGSFSIIAIFAAGRTLFNKNTGLIAALILATSIFHITYSQEARSYSMLTLLSLISCYYFLKIISSQKKLFLAGYAISSILLLYTHYYGTLIIATQNIFFFTNLLRARAIGELSLKNWLSLQLLLVLLFLPGLLILLNQAYAIQEGFWINEITFYELLGFFNVYS